MRLRRSFIATTGELFMVFIFVSRLRRSYGRVARIHRLRSDTRSIDQEVR